jgi:hypothetical protein
MKGAVFEALCAAIDGITCHKVVEDCSGGPCTMSVTNEQVSPSTIQCNESRIQLGVSPETRALLLRPTVWNWEMRLVFACQVDVANIIERFKRPVHVPADEGDQLTRPPGGIAPILGYLEEVRMQHGLDADKASTITLIFNFSEDF